MIFALLLQLEPINCDRKLFRDFNLFFTFYKYFKCQQSINLTPRYLGLSSLAMEVSLFLVSYVFPDCKEEEQ